MFEKIKNIFAQLTQNQDKTLEKSDAIAAPKPVIKVSSAFVPFDAVLPNQSIPGKFDYHSPTWKYLDNYFAERTQALHSRNESIKLDIEQTSVIRGQLKEIKLLLKHTNHLAGVSSSPATQSPSNPLADEGNYYE